MQNTVACDWIHCSLRLLPAGIPYRKKHLLNLSAKLSADIADVKVADPPVVSTADPDSYCSSWSIFPLALQLVDVIFFLSFDQHLLSTSDQLLLLSSTTDQTSHFRMRPVLFPPKRPNEQDSLLHNLIHLTAAQLLMTSRLLKSSISLDDVTTAEYFSFASIQTFLLHNC
ncbi:hypothetical protein F511_26036 [Dorcoceras hygrometricum]|uniref:Uncharacterized protein n=1 Tax=Dorcoceras hygrometricum TaxID=472368 RepID=A0A2Z7CSG1_9LAMI|nr:hypothetical protein F511_26036 [Dorcoceras hygrometricum]